MCTSPLIAYPIPGGVSFSRPAGHSGRTVELPCRQCTHCRIMREAEWAVRIMHEALFYPDRTWFVTNTLSPEFASVDSSVSKETHRRYMKRVRRAFGPTRYVAVGEYGKRTKRAHYHYGLFGPLLTDLKFAGKNDRGERYYRSPALEAVWPFGFVEVSPLDFGLAKYLAGYLARDRNAKREGSADYVHDDGTVVARELPFFTMSRRPGIGREYVEKYGAQLGAGDFIVVDGRKHFTPSYYRRIVGEYFPDLAKRLDAEREAAVYTPEAKAARRPARRAAKAAILEAKLSRGRKGRSRGAP